MKCWPEDLKKETANSWPDVPQDRICAADTKCTAEQSAPTFWTRRRLIQITTQIRSGSSWSPVDSWLLTHLFTDNADGSRSLWLHSITQRGHVGGGEPQAMPPVSFDAQQLPNLIVNPDRLNVEFVRPRLAKVHTEAGGSIDVKYYDADCSAGSLPKPGNSTKRCYPVVWHPGGREDPVTDWFHKYVVESVTEMDLVPDPEKTDPAVVATPHSVTRYQYLGDAGWRHSDADGITEAKYLTWSEWRGYKQVVVRRGDGQIMTTRTDHTYLRGLHGDKDPDGGTRDVVREDSVGTSYTDYDDLSGFEIETAVYDGDKVISKALSSPWRHETASESHTWGTGRAFFVQPASSRTLVALESGGWRESKVVTSYDPELGRATQVDDLGDVSTAADDRCTRTSYADDANANLRAFVSRTETVAVKCAATPDRAKQVLTDERVFYDGKGFGQAPSKGDVTRAERLKSHDGATASYVLVGESTYDDWGRPKTSTNAKGISTSYDYTHVDGLLTKTVVTAPTKFTTTTEYAPAWGQTQAEEDWNGYRTDLEFDKLGRLINVWLPDQPKALGQKPNIKYTYNVQATEYSWVKTERIENDGKYTADYQIFDALLNLRQTQAAGPGGGRLVAETFYTPTRQIAKTNNVHFASGPPSGVILGVANGDADQQTEFLYDGADRVTHTITLRSGDERWRTVARYGGDRVHVDPPTGATPTTTLADARGQTTELRQYHGDGPSGDYDRTQYTYTPAGQQASVVDPAENKWTYTYDQRGRKIQSEDPDSGKTKFGYDDLDRLETTTNARGVTITYTYDDLNRKTATFQGDAQSGTKLAAWVYDTKFKGQLFTASRFVNGQAYIQANMALDRFYRIRRTRYVIPDDAGTNLKKTYDFTTDYNHDGTVQGVTFPDAGDLPGEAVVYQYDEEKLKRLVGINATHGSYANGFNYAQTGELLKVVLTTGGKQATALNTYEQGTKRLLRSQLFRGPTGSGGDPTSGTQDIDQAYTYDHAGNVLSIADTPSAGQTDIQCFRYDYLRRMTEAWTSGSSAEDPCAGGAGVTGVGGPAPYHHSYTYDNVGNRVTEQIHAVGATPAAERKYAYPDPGQPQAHALRSVTEKTAAGDRLYSYEYNEAGQTTKRPGAVDGQQLTWDAEGHLASLTEDGKTTRFVYDADGNRLVRKEPDATTLYLPGMELRLDHRIDTVSTTRYLTMVGQATAVRTAQGVQFQFADHHATGQAGVDASTGAIEIRRSTPFGGPRGEQPAAGKWLGQKGFVGGVKDDTGLTHLGAREYDPAIGRFISVDPIQDLSDPQQWNGYAYAHNSPITSSDPTGLIDTDCLDHACYGYSVATSTCPYGCGTEKNVNWGKANNKASTAPLKASNIYSGRTHDGRPYPDASKGERWTPWYYSEFFYNQHISNAEFDHTVYADLCRDYGEGCEGLDDSAPGVNWGNAIDGVAGLILIAAAPEIIAVCGGAVVACATQMADDAVGFYGYGSFAGTAGGAAAAGRGLAGRGGPPCSFSGDTQVQMADGTTKPIEEIAVGDEVLATDPDTGKQGSRQVTATFVHDDLLVDLLVDGKSLITTEDHPFWNETDQQWQRADLLTPGDKLLLPDGRVAPVGGIRPGPVLLTFAHNLTVEDIHTYYVLAGNTPVLVHNCGGKIPWSSGRVSSAARSLDDGATKVTVGSRAEAEELFLRKYQGAGYRNASGFDGVGTKQYFGEKRGTYHWDDQVGADGRVLGHGPGNVDGALPHLQIHTFDGPIVRIFWGG